MKTQIQSQTNTNTNENTNTIANMDAMFVTINLLTHFRPYHHINQNYHYYHHNNYHNHNFHHHIMIHNHNFIIFIINLSTHSCFSSWVATSTVMLNSSPDFNPDSSIVQFLIEPFPKFGGASCSSNLRHENNIIGVWGLVLVALVEGMFHQTVKQCEIKWNF